MIHLDTHVVAWLYQGRLDLIPSPVQALLDKSDLAMSPVVTLELQYLFEIARVSEPGQVVVSHLSRKIGLRIDATPFADVVDRAMGLDWTRDPLNRLIVAQADAAGARLVTRDQQLLAHSPVAVWA